VARRLHGGDGGRIKEPVLRLGRQSVRFGYLIASGVGRFVAGPQRSESEPEPIEEQRDLLEWEQQFYQVPLFGVLLPIFRRIVGGPWRGQP
jgi:hypothetical protein